MNNADKIKALVDKAFEENLNKKNDIVENEEVIINTEVMEQELIQDTPIEKIVEETDSEDYKKFEIYQKIINNKATSEKNKIYNCDCIEKLKETNSKIIDLTILDPPYYKVVSEKWDNEWKSEEEFLSWFENIIVYCTLVIIFMIV